MSLYSQAWHAIQMAIWGYGGRGKGAWGLHPFYMFHRSDHSLFGFWELQLLETE